MRVYVASAFGNLAEAREVMAALRAAGHVITHDWTQDRLEPDWTPEQKDAYLQNSGRKDFEGVCTANALVLVNHADCRDSMTEFGIALGLYTPVYVLHRERRASVFFHRATHVSSIAELLWEIAP